MSHVPIISILTPTFNRAGTFLSETIRFVQKQYEKGFTHEHIIVDNASEDNTEEIVRSFMKEDSRIKYIRNEKNLYASGALNVAFEHSVGEIIVPFDDDDIMPALSLQARYDSLRNPTIQWSSGQALLVDQERRLKAPGATSGEFISQAIRPFLDENNELIPSLAQAFFLSFFRQWMICNDTVSVRRRCIEEVGGWNAAFKGSQDTDMWIKLASKHFPYKLINDYVAFYRTHTNQISLQNSQNGVWKEIATRLRETYGITEEILDAAGIAK